MAFHNFSSLISSHERQFELIQKNPAVRDPNTSRMKPETDKIPIRCFGVFETITEKDFAKFPDMEFQHSDLKLTTTPQKLKNVTPELKHKISYNGIVYWIKRIINKVHYGGYYIIFMKEEETVI